MSKVLTFLEDMMHVKFLNYCNELIFPHLNAECSHCLEASAPYSVDKLRGKDEILSNALPSFLFMASRFLIFLDFDNNSEEELMLWVRSKIEGAKTKGTIGGPEMRIKVVEQRDNIFKVLVGGNEKTIIILPLGLPDLHAPRLSSHTVEDYVLEQIPDMTFGNPTTSKDLLDKHQVNETKKDTLLKKGIEHHRNRIEDYLRPLWV